jgi:uncharacterized protein (TIGR02996 family)
VLGAARQVTWDGMAGDQRNIDLERAIVENPNDLEAYLVYADWLIEHGDPRGELVTAQAATERGGADERRAAIAVFARHRDYFLGPLGDLLRADAFDWRRGFIHHARLANRFLVVAEGQLVEMPLADIADALFRHPSARFLIKLTIGDVDPIARSDWWRRATRTEVQSVLQRIAAGAPATLRELKIDPAARCRLDAACAGLPRLTDLEIAGSFAINVLDLPELHTATFRPDGISGIQLRDLALAKVPKLASLTLEFGDPNRGSNPAPTLADLDPLLRRVDLPLAHLAIVGCQFANHLLERIATAPILAGLSELQITDGSLTDQGVRLIARTRGAFSHLELFDVTGHKLSASGLRLLRSIAPNVIA